MRRLLLGLLLLMATATGSLAQTSTGVAGQRFVSIAFHDIVDDPANLDTDAVTTAVLVRFFDWLKGNGWTALSLDDIAAAHAGRRPLPDKSILITFDDGYRSLYTHVYPLLRTYRFPAVAALVGSWMAGPAEGAADGLVQYGDRLVPRDHFITWSQAREMQASGLIEFASHSYALHRGILANPQGNMTPAATTWRYDPASRSYETDAQYRARITADLARSRQYMAANLGRPPRAMVWPFGRYSGPALDIARAQGFQFALSLEPEPATTADLFQIHRYFPAQNPSLGDIVRNLRFEPGQPTTRRIACLTLDALATVEEGAAQDELLGRMIEGLRTLGANTAIIDAGAALPTPESPLGDVFYPTPLRPLRRDLLSRAVWQVRTRAGSDVYVRLPLGAAARAVGEANVPALFADMMRRSTPDGIAFDAAEPLPASRPVADRSDEVRARRIRLDAASLPPTARLGFAAWRAAAAVDPRQHLLVTLAQPAGPPAWADLAILPPQADAGATRVLAARLRDDGFLRPDAAGRIAFSLPREPARQVDAMRGAQRDGAAAFALCPGPTSLPPSPALAATFSADTYAKKP